MLIGRDRELRPVTALLEEALRGRSGTLVKSPVISQSSGWATLRCGCTVSGVISAKSSREGPWP